MWNNIVLIIKKIEKKKEKTQIWVAKRLYANVAYNKNKNSFPPAFQNSSKIFFFCIIKQKFKI